MTETMLYETLTAIFQDVFMHDVELRPELTAKDVTGWDSLKQISILLALEEHFGIKFHTKELDALHSVGDLIRILSIKTRDL